MQIRNPCRRRTSGLSTRIVLEFVRYDLRSYEDIDRAGEVNRACQRTLFVRFYLPSTLRILSNQRSNPQNKMAAVSAEGQYDLALGPSFEFLAEPFDRVGCSRTLPLADG